MSHEPAWSDVPAWPASIEELERVQVELGRAAPPAWQGPVAVTASGLVAGCFVCFGRGGGGSWCGAAGDRGWAGAAAVEGLPLLPGGRPGPSTGGRIAAVVSVTGQAGLAYDPGHLALREGVLLESALRALPSRPDLLLVNATGRDHPRRAGLALHLGARLDLPSVGVTNRVLVAQGEWPADERFARSPLRFEDEIVGYWVRTRRGTRPVAVHAGWRTDAQTAFEIAVACVLRARTPEPLRVARRAAREARERSHRG